MLVDCGKNRAGIVIETEVAAVVSYIAYDVAGDFSDVRIAIGRYFAHNEHDARSCAYLARNVRVFVFFEYVVQNGVGNLVADLIGMPFRNAFRCK